MTLLLVVLLVLAATIALGVFFVWVLPYYSPPDAPLAIGLGVFAIWNYINTVYWGFTENSANLYWARTVSVDETVDAERTFCRLCSVDRPHFDHHCPYIGCIHANNYL